MKRASAEQIERELFRDMRPTSLLKRFESPDVGFPSLPPCADVLDASPGAVESFRDLCSGNIEVTAQLVQPSGAKRELRSHRRAKPRASAASIQSCACWARGHTELLR